MIFSLTDFELGHWLPLILQKYLVFEWSWDISSTGCGHNYVDQFIIIKLFIGSFSLENPDQYRTYKHSSFGLWIKPKGTSIPELQAFYFLL